VVDAQRPAGLIEGALELRAAVGRPRQLAASSTAYRATRAEQETVIRWDRVDDSVDVWSADPVTWRKLERLGIPVGRETRFPGGAVSGRFYTIPLSRFGGDSSEPGPGPQAAA
jgi:hypothetical protein